MSAIPTAAVTVAPDAITITWVVAGGIIAELLILIVFLVRVAWWLSQRFTLIDASFAASAREIAAIRADVSNDIAGRKAVREGGEDFSASSVMIRAPLQPSDEGGQVSGHASAPGAGGRHARPSSIHANHCG